MKSLITLFAVLGFVSVAHADNAAQPATTTTAPAAAMKAEPAKTDAAAKTDAKPAHKHGKKAKTDAKTDKTM